MSRIGRQPIAIPSGVKVSAGPEKVIVVGPKGTLSYSLNSGIAVKVVASQVLVTRESDSRDHRALHGLARSLVANMVTGVTQGFQKSLEIVGVGYRAQESGKGVTVQVGFSHPVEIQALEGTTLSVEGNNRIHVRGCDKQLVGEMAARIRAIRPPDAYKGKGIRYVDERVRLKPGKSATRSR